MQGRHPLQTSDALGAAGSGLGADAQASVCWLNESAGLSHGKIVGLLKTLFGIELSRGGSAQIVARGPVGEPAYQEIQEAIRGSPTNAADETGWRIGGQSAWQHVLVNERATCYLIDRSRGADVPARVLPLDHDGVLLHDGWEAYGQFTRAVHGQCNAHALRRGHELHETVGRSPRRCCGVCRTSFAGRCAVVIAAAPGRSAPRGPITWVYDATLNLPTSFTDELNRTTSYTYDVNGNLLTVTSPLGHVTTYEYSTRGQVTKITLPDPDGTGPRVAPVTLLAYDTSGGLTQITNPDSSTRTFTYSTADQLLTETDELGRTTSYQWDELDRLTSITYADPDGTGPLAASVIALAWDAASRLTSRTDPAGNVTSYSYNQRDWLTSITLPDPDGGGTGVSPVIQRGYNAAGSLTTQTDPLGNVTTYAYDNAQRLTSITLQDPDGGGPLTGPVTSFTLDNLGRTTKVTDPRGSQTQLEYDSRNRLTKRTEADPDGAAGPLTAPVTQWAFDVAGQLTSQTDALARVTSWQYDLNGRVTKVTLPDPDGAGALTAPEYLTSYDNLGNVLTETDPLGNVTSYEYDGRSRVTKTIDARSGQTQYGWDVASQLTSLTDAVGNVTSWSYDNLGRVTSETNALAKSRTYFYDVNSNLTELTDRNGRLTEFVYDNLSRQTQEIWKDSANNTLRTITSTYDAASQLTAISDADSSYSYGYDMYGRVTQVDNAGTPGVPNVVLTSEYDKANNRTKLSASVNGTADFVNTYQFDALDRMTRIEQTDGTPSAGLPISAKRVDLAYNAASQFSTITRYADLAGTDLVATSSYSYDGMGRLTDLSHMKGASTLADYSYTFDAASRITAVTSTDGTTTYSYDATSQLTAADHSYQTDESYTYNYSGGRTDADNVHGGATG